MFGLAADGKTNLKGMPNPLKAGGRRFDPGTLHSFREYPAARKRSYL